MYLYSVRCQAKKPNTKELQAYIFKIRNFELYKAKSTGNVNKHLQKWCVTNETYKKRKNHSGLEVADSSEP